MSNKKYLEQYRAYMFELTTIDAVLDKQLEVTLAFEGSKIDEIEYNYKMKALEILESQLRETEVQKQRYLNAGQVI